MSNHRSPLCKSVGRREHPNASDQDPDGEGKGNGLPDQRDEEETFGPGDRIFSRLLDNPKGYHFVGRCGSRRNTYLSIASVIAEPRLKAIQAKYQKINIRPGAAAV